MKTGTQGTEFFFFGGQQFKKILTESQTNDGVAEPRRHADSNSTIFVFSEICFPGHLQAILGDFQRVLPEGSL